MDCNQTDSSVHWILQAKILEWVVIPFSREFSQPSHWTRVSCFAGRFFTIWDKFQIFTSPWLTGRDSLVAQLVKSACNVGDLGWIPGLARSPEKEMATHSSILAWKIPWMEEPGGLQSMGLLTVIHNWLHATSLFPVVLDLKDKVKMITGKHCLRSSKRLKISLKFGESKQ